MFYRVICLTSFQSLSAPVATLPCLHTPRTHIEEGHAVTGHLWLHCMSSHINVKSVPRMFPHIPHHLLYVLWNWTPFSNSSCHVPSSLRIFKLSIPSSWNTVLFLSKKLPVSSSKKQQFSVELSFSWGSLPSISKLSQVSPCHSCCAKVSHTPLVYYLSPPNTHHWERAQTLLAALSWHLGQWEGIWRISS